MKHKSIIRPNMLGDLRAESDQSMLNSTFIETADYRTLIETSDKIVIVGRRGTGKSALTIQLEKSWKKEDNLVVLKISPEEHQTYGIRPKLAQFGDSFVKIRAGARLVWRYALMMEAAQLLQQKYKFPATTGYKGIEVRVQSWMKLRGSVLDKYSQTLKDVVSLDLSPEERISDLSVSLDLTNTENAFISACEESDSRVAILIDRLDEGYEPDDSGIGLVDGLVQASIDLKTKTRCVRPVIFLRDNIFRSVQKNDPDYSRNIEGHVLRLHWDRETLFTFVTKRLRQAFEIDQESSVKIWNACAAGELKGKAGFDHCLHLTLYRPRDLLSLLNDSFYLAGKGGGSQIIFSHIQDTGRTISRNRLEDLKKEYEHIFPGLAQLIAAFHGGSPDRTVEDTVNLINGVLNKGSDDPKVAQSFFILDEAKTVIRSLYSVGFLGVRDGSTGAFVFCHDGRSPDREFSSPDRVLIHPCYWMALNSERTDLDQKVAEEIHDEYDIEISSETPQIRNNKIRKLINELNAIETGTQGATEFENWCHKAIRICFAKGLVHVELKANKQANSRRDVVATNLGEGDAWRRIYEDYGTRQVTFEVKNYQGISAADYQQVQSYLTGDYGRLGFIITRDDSVDLYANRDVEWVRELYSTHKVIVIKLTAKFLAGLLDKLRKPQKHDAVNNAVHRLLDTYTRLYIAGQTSSAPKKPSRRRQSRRSKKV